jgi:hypothetical protein
MMYVERMPINPDVVYVSVDPSLMHQAADEYLDTSSYARWDLPSAEVVTPVATAVLAAIIANGIEPKSVVLSGYDRHAQQDQIDTIKNEQYPVAHSVERLNEIVAELTTLSDRLHRLNEQGILSEQMRSSMAQEIAMLHQERTRLKTIQAGEEPIQYFFAEHNAMFDNHSGDNNPIFYAGGDSGATIGIYDRSKLAQIEPDIAAFDSDPDTIHAATLVRAQLESAKLIECYVHYGSSQD